MANFRIARFVTEAAPPQFVQVMRQRATKMLDTIKEDEKEASMNDSHANVRMSALSASLTSTNSANTSTSAYFTRAARRPLSLFGDN
ncbi:unnamed protein product [Coffea canephora]|uniref:DH200=94 genomic scaffold, scaffold_162 n=1 Tax=Coffea canephora TaxID=49390 RepID=A0A068VA67_COFCA|nr:unnamed protein product [Coffea canephora]